MSIGIVEAKPRHVQWEKSLFFPMPQKTSGVLHSENRGESG